MLPPPKEKDMTDPFIEGGKNCAIGLGMSVDAPSLPGKRFPYLSMFMLCMLVAPLYAAGRLTASTTGYARCMNWFELLFKPELSMLSPPFRPEELFF